MSLNTKQSFSLSGTLVMSLYGKIMKLQRVHRATTEVKTMLSDNTVSLKAAVDTILADPDYEENPATVLAKTYVVEGYLLEADQVPPSITVEQIGEIRPFINL